MIRNCIYFLGIILSLFSIPILIYSIKNKNSNSYKSIIKIVIACLLCLFIDILLMPELLWIEVGFEFLLVELIVFIAVIIYIISILLNLIKIKKLQIYQRQKEISMATDIISIIGSFIALCIIFMATFIISGRILFRVFGEDSWVNICIYSFILIAGILYIISTILNLRKDKKRHIEIKHNEIVFVMILMILPTLVLCVSVFKEKYLIDHSDLLLFYYSRGGGGIGEGKNFAYAIRKNTCEEFELGTSTSGYKINGLLPNTATEIKNTDEIKDYEITFDGAFGDSRIIVKKGQKIICEKKTERALSNYDFERGFYINR